MFDNCKNVNVQAMLVPYVERVLAASNRAEVEEHLQSCEECRHRVSVIRETLKTMSELARDGYRPSMERHLSAGQIFSFALERHLLLKPDLTKIQHHLSSCSACAAEVSALQQIDSAYQKRVITVGTSDLLPALKRSRVPSSSGSFECVSPQVPAVAPSPTFWDYCHLLSHRVNLPRVGAAVLVFALLIFALSSAFRGDDGSGNKLGDIADKTADAIATLPSPSASSIAVTISVEDGQIDQLCYLLRSSDIPYEQVDGKVRIPADYVAKAQQLWIEAVERSQTAAAGTSEAAAADSAAPAAAEAESAPESSETYSGSDSDAYSADSYSSSGSGSSGSSYAEQISSDTPAPAAEPDNSTSYNSAAAPVSQPEERPVSSAPKPILRPLHQTAAPVQRAASSSTGMHTAAPSSSASRPRPKPPIVAPTAAPVVSASTAVEREVSTNDIPVAPQVVRMGAQPSVGIAESEESQVVTPTPRSVYEGTGADDNSGIGAWSNDL